MFPEVEGIAAASSWVGIFATIQLSRRPEKHHRHPRTRSSRPPFDDAVATPINAPKRLDEIIRNARTALENLPPAHLLSHRTMPARVHLQHIAHDAFRARARVDFGTYGTCTDCAGPMPFALLDEKPWAPRCVSCAQPA